MAVARASHALTLRTSSAQANRCSLHLSGRRTPSPCSGDDDSDDEIVESRERNPLLLLGRGLQAPIHPTTMAPNSRIVLCRHSQAEHNVDLDYSSAWRVCCEP